VLCDAGLPPRYLVNRSPARAAALAAECGAQVVSLDAFLRGEAPVDVVLCATAAPGLVLDAAALARLAAATPGGGPLLTVDLAVPRDVAPLDDPRVRRIDLDDLRAAADRNKALRLEAAGQAEQLVDRKVETLARRYGETAAAPEVAELRQAATDILDRELGGLLSGRLAHLAEADRRAVERWARATFGRVMHLPVAALKRLAGELAERPRDDCGDADRGPS
jgi:glutamyl-tRNA reductase